MSWVKIIAIVDVRRVLRPRTGRHRCRVDQSYKFFLVTFPKNHENFNSQRRTRE